MQEFNYYFITNKPEIASYVESCGVKRIFVDLEILGKKARQGHLDTVISNHHVSDIKKIKNVIKHADILVRLNPFNENSEQEINDAIKNGATMIMLPMINDIDAVSSFIKIINGRVKFIPLIETIYSSENIELISSLDGVDEIHIGLNDLHLEMNKGFMFELYTDGTLDRMIPKIKKPFGIGGIARVDAGLINGKLVMAEHIRFGSTAAILSRAFHNNAKSVDELHTVNKFQEEFNALTQERENLLLTDKLQLNAFHIEFNNKIQSLKLERNS
ncbi:aldolase/citrate lyase family protein [Escherichia coli]|uniref:aldolase/citrate lyase family protein n=2 Tax=Escherichia coli TaxID=562 RepID=UPI000DEFF1FC|nr:aldolase/citrate lyase family protein [Escherichia coli]EFM9900887.1 aldolase [Escherichia coli]MCQ6644873.1 HpcH/HpaI aldolase/citrate lyase family protein [Escherichia coli]